MTLKIKVHERKVKENQNFLLSSWKNNKNISEVVCPYCGEEMKLERVDTDGDGLEDWWCNACQKDFVVENELRPVRVYYGK